MLKSEARRKEITARLSILTYYIRLCNKQGLTDANKEAEDFFCGLLNIIFDTDLKNMNYIQRDYAAIDLGDREEALAIQVTSTNSRDKIEHTLAEFFGHDLDQVYNQLIVLIIGEKIKYRKKFQTKRRFRFDPDQDVWDTARLCDEIMQLADEKQDEVLRYLEARMVIPEPAPQQPAPAPAPRPVFGERKLKNYLPDTLGANGFKGRQRELGELAQAFARREKPIFITGLGGMGKTELAVRFCQERQEDCRVHFVRFAGTFKDTVTLGIASGIENLRYGESIPNEQIYSEAMRVLEDCDSKTILIIDNADPADGNFDSLKDETYRKLCRMNLRLIITTRAHVHGGVNVKRMDSDELREIIGRYAEISEADADALIEAVDGHTLTVDLMGRAMQPGWKRVTPAMLLEALRNHNLSDSIGKTVTTDYNRDKQENAQRKIHEHLRTVFNMADIPDNARQVMACATLLPEGGMDADLFANALPADAQEALDALANRAWLRVSNTGLVTVHPVIRLICCEELKPNDEICRVFLENLWGNYDKKGYDHDRYSAMAELYTTAAEMLDNKRGGWSGRARALWCRVGQYEKALPCAGMTIQRREAALPPDHPDLADAYNDMGIAYAGLMDHQGMTEYYGKALEIRRRVLAEDHVDLAKSYNNVGVAYEAQGDYRTALSYKLKAMEIFEKILPADDLDLATSYTHVGGAYGELGDPRKELEYMEKALRIREKVLPPDHPDLASTYDNVGHTYYRMGDYRKALDYVEKALKIHKQVLPPDHPDLATAYNNVGVAYSTLGDPRKELEYEEKALRIREQVLPLDHPELATSYNNVGVTYNDLGDHRKALEYHERALKICKKVLPADHPDLAETYYWMGRTYGELRNDSLALVHLEKALSIYEARLPPGHPDTKNTRDWIAHYKRKLERPSWMSQIQ